MSDNELKIVTESNIICFNKQGDSKSLSKNSTQNILKIKQQQSITKKEGEGNKSS